MGRIKYLEIMRGIATLGVIIIHVSSNNWYGNIGSMDWVTFTVYECLARFSVPAFFMISGALFLKEKREINVKKLYAHSILRLLVFLLFWSVIYKVVQLENWQADPVQNLKSIINDIAMGNTQVHLWYIYAIIGLYLLMPLFQLIARAATREQLKYVIGISFVFFSLMPFLSTFAPLGYLTNNFYKVSAGLGFGYFPFLFIGHYIDKYPVATNRKRTLYGLGIASLVFSIGLIIYDCISTGTLSERGFGYTTPFVVMYSTAVFLLIKNAKLPAVAEKLFTFIAKYSLGIYGCHMLFVICLWKFGIDTFLFNGILSVPVISVAVLGFSVVFSFLLKKIPVMGAYIS